jgi:signal transduction histidine kinase
VSEPEQPRVHEPDLVLDAAARRRVLHDARTPMTVIAGFAEVLASDRAISEDDRRDYAARIADAAGELRQLIERLLD